MRELKQLGVAVEFEKEGIDTGNMGSEMLLSILGSAAQEESLSISKNLKWSYRRRMKSGDFITCNAPLGYFLKDGVLVPDPQEVPIVQYIFSSYLAGHSMDEIATFLNDQEAKYSRKEMTRWYRTSIRYILSNEKYIGDSLLQKTFTPNELPLVNIRNRGQLSQFYVKDSHPAIIPLEMFEAVQRLMKRRAATHTAKPKPGGFPLSHMMKCGFCGSTFQRHLKKEGARWCCYQHRKDKSLCVMEVVAESEVYQTFLLMYNKLLDNKNLILRVMLAQLIELQSKTTFARPEIVDLHQIISDLARQNHSLSRLQAKGCIDSAIFIERSNRNNKLIEELRFELRQLQEPDRVSETIDQTNLLLDLLDDAQPMLEFEPSIFKSMIKEITVYPEKFSFVLSNGLVLCEMRR